MVTVVPDFGWLLVLTSGNLLAFSLRDMMPASDTATWVMLGKLQARVLSDPTKVVAFVRVGFTKGRLLGELRHRTELICSRPRCAFAPFP
jgi:hypothetical protein